MYARFFCDSPRCYHYPVFPGDVCPKCKQLKVKRKACALCTHWRYNGLHRSSGCVSRDTGSCDNFSEVDYEEVLVAENVNEMFNKPAHPETKRILKDIILGRIIGAWEDILDER